jgi:hypothetical protein
MYKSGTTFPVYCHDCWWGDKWDATEYGTDYDFSKSFFEQFKSLQEKVPKPALYESANTNSEYCNHTAHMKDSYLIFGSWFSENCGYGQTLSECKDCWDSIFMKKCEFCFSSTDCTNCNETHFSDECTNCISSAFLYDCRNCQNCMFSYNLRNKNYYVFNEKVSKEDYEKIKKETFSSYQSFLESFKKFKEAIQLLTPLAEEMPNNLFVTVALSEATCGSYQCDNGMKRLARAYTQYPQHPGILFHYVGQ